MKELRSLPHRVSLGLSGGGGEGGGGVGQDSSVFSAIPHLELGKTALPKGLDFGLFG